jgi:hypothetical protein
VQCIGGLRVIVFYVSCVFTEPSCKTSACLSNICFMACLAGSFINATFFHVLGGMVVFSCCCLVCCVGAFECYFGVCMFEKIGNFPDFGAMVRECGPFFVRCFLLVLCCVFLFLVS